MDVVTVRNDFTLPARIEKISERVLFWSFPPEPSSISTDGEQETGDSAKAPGRRLGVYSYFQPSPLPPTFTSKRLICQPRTLIWITFYRYRAGIGPRLGVFG
ncbi:hypothetical protein ElyMa_004708300 [Elysia marginata]|uniref:Uncharacterized protein n=1 Tax=Elysia marginata TaxID=1093978 RepID=A0AAV4IBI7_9GAST|nr:hypothetical protein ElyMa_004708300 [Elysia marginata]